MRHLSLAALLCTVIPSLLQAQEDSDEKLFHRVMSRLLATDLVKAEYPSKYAFPPKYFVKPGLKELNAYATAHEKLGAVIDPETRKIRPVVMITEGYLKQVVKGDENVLAAIMGHELAHLTKDHVGGRKGDTLLLLLAFSRDHEIEADLDGMRYAVAAGFPYKESITGAIREMKAVTKYTSFEGLHSTHPSWEERMSFLDREQTKLWSSMSAFNNGYVFLELEQYAAAEQCFKAVVKEFPECYEAWANLGYSQLMRYCDALDADDLRSYNIGHIVAGCFYARPASLESKVRGIDEKMWTSAVKSLNTALALKKDLMLPHVCLGIAHLVHPEGKDTKRAAKFFADAIDNVRKDKAVKENPATVISLLINCGVADLASGNREGAERRFKSADRAILDLGKTPLFKTLDDALLYNLALVDSEASDPEQKKTGLKKWTLYLSETSPDSAWWTLAYERYTKLSGELGIKAVPREFFAREEVATPKRLATSIEVDGQTIFLSQPMEDALSHLDKKTAVEQPLYTGSKLVRWRSTRGVDVLGKDKVIAIFLTDEKGPGLKLQAAGASTKVREIRVGMSESEAEEVLKGHRMDRTAQYLASRDERYRFYPSLGLAVRFGDGRVRELALAQVPRVTGPGR